MTTVRVKTDAGVIDLHYHVEGNVGRITHLLDGEPITRGRAKELLVVRVGAEKAAFLLGEES